MTELLTKSEEIGASSESEAKKEYTFEEVYELNSRGGRYELVDGELREKISASFTHGEIILKLGGELCRFVSQNKLGRTSTKAGFILRQQPRLLRFPDISFVRQERIPAEGVPQGYWEIAPDLAIEVVSTNDLVSDVFNLAAEYIERGVKEVWVVIPEGRCVLVYHSFEEQRILTTKDNIESNEIVPGFSLAVSKLFGEVKTK